MLMVGAGLQHGANLVLLLVEFALNAMPYEPYLLGWTGLYSSAYALWAFSYYKATNRWMYPVGPCAAYGVLQGAAANVGGLSRPCPCPAACAGDWDLRPGAGHSGVVQLAAEAQRVGQRWLQGRAAWLAAGVHPVSYMVAPAASGTCRKPHTRPCLATPLGHPSAASDEASVSAVPQCCTALGVCGVRWGVRWTLGVHWPLVRPLAHQGSCAEPHWSSNTSQRGLKADCSRRPAIVQSNALQAAYQPC